MDRTGVYIVLCVISINGAMGLYRHTYSACYGITTDNFIKASCPGADEKIVMDTVYAYAKPSSSGCPEVMTSATETPKSCCRYEAGDCGFEYDGFNKYTYYENCHSRTTCSWTPVAWANAPCNSSVYPPRTSYMAVYFYCISENGVKDVSEDGSVNTTTALLLNPGYESGNDTGTLPANSSFKCSISASCATSLKIRALNLNFTEEGGICGQSLTITDGTNTQVLTCDSNTNYLPTDINVGNNTHYLEIQVTNTLDTDSGYFLLQIGGADGDDSVTLACGTSVGEGRVAVEDLPECSNETTTTDTTTMFTDNNTDTTTSSNDNTDTTTSTDDYTDNTTSTDNNTAITTSTDNNTGITTSTDNNTDTTTSTDNNTNITTSTDNNTDTTTSTDNNTNITTSTDNNTDTTTPTDNSRVAVDNSPATQPVEDESKPFWIWIVVILAVLLLGVLFVFLFKNRLKIKDLYIRKCRADIHPEKGPPELDAEIADENYLFAPFEKSVLPQVAPVSVVMHAHPPTLNGRHKLVPLTCNQQSMINGKGIETETQNGNKTEKEKRRKKKHKKDKKKKNVSFVPQVDDLRSSTKSTSVTVDVTTVI